MKGKASLFILALLVCASFPGCNRDNNPEDTPVLQLVLVSGNSQTGVANIDLQAPIVVRLLDDSQTPLAGERVYFRAVAGGGGVNRSEATTDNNGEASVYWRLGGGPEQILKASLFEGSSAVGAVYVYANSRLSSAIGWTQGIDFYAYDHRYSHDNRILESANFLVFSDGASDDVRVIYDKMAEESFSELLQAFAVDSPGDLGIHPDDNRTKITIYSIKDANIDQMAFRFGFILYGQDSSNYQHWGVDDFWFRREVKHETMHVVQWLFGLDPGGTGSNLWPDVWFTEGIAEYISGGAFTPITSLGQWQNWLGVSGHDNPIAIHRWADFKIPYGRTGEYYPAFGLAVRYLLDSRGAGRTLLDVKAMYADMVANGDFLSSFRKTFAMSVEEYESHFPELIVDYLERTGSFVPPGTRGIAALYQWSDRPRNITE